MCAKYVYNATTLSSIKGNYKTLSWSMKHKKVRFSQVKLKIMLRDYFINAEVEASKIINNYLIPRVLNLIKD